jgi:pSer/pThr/pTyr-binding forkhead associated (FHA) protein
VRTGPLVGLSFALAGGTLTVGRDPANDVVLRDQTVSRRHARIDARGGGWVVTDLGSTNGTAVGGRTLQPNQETQLSAGTEVRFGDVTMNFEG